jgi:transposase-like protein
LPDQQLSRCLWYVFLDATAVKGHDGASVVSKAIVVATGVTAKGARPSPASAATSTSGRSYQ